MRPATPEEIAEQFRDRKEDFVSYLIEQYAASSPEYVEAKGDVIAYHIGNAFDDACRLDFHATNLGANAVFLPGFMKSVFYTEGFTEAIHAFIQIPLDQKSSKGFREAIEQGSGEDGAFLLMQIKEYVLEGNSTADALIYYASAIGRHIAAGDTNFVQTLGTYLAQSKRRPPLRSVQAWIIRAWLPLALWENIPVRDKVKRLRKADAVLKKAGANLIPIPSTVAKLVTTVESKIRSRKR